MRNFKEGTQTVKKLETTPHKTNRKHLDPRIANLIKALCFLALCTVLFLGLNLIYRMPYEKGSHMEETVQRYNALYKEKKNTWDGVILGTSITDRGWAAPAAWHDHGFTIYPLSTDSQPIVLSANILDEVRKRQNIRLVVLELHGITSSALNAKEVSARRVTDNLHSTQARIAACSHLFSFTNEHFGTESRLKDTDIWSMYFPFIKYHSRTDLTLEDLTSPTNEMMGVVTKKSLAFKSKPQAYPDITDESVPLTKAQTDFLDEITNYADENALEILFLSIPSGHKQSAQKEVNGALDYVAQKGYATLNMNTEEIYKEIGLDFSTDFYNKKHMNSMGAKKTTAYLSRYIAEHFDLEDKRGQEAYADWDKAYELYADFYRTGWSE